MLTPGRIIVETCDVVIGGAGMAAAAQGGASVLVIEKASEMGGNTLVSGGAFQAEPPSMVWDPSAPETSTGLYEPRGTTVRKVQSDVGRRATLKTILDWNEKPFDGTVRDKGAIASVDDYNIPDRGVHAEYRSTFLTRKDQIRAYFAYADKHLGADQKETDLTLISTAELRIFQTYYGGMNHEFT